MALNTLLKLAIDQQNHALVSFQSSAQDIAALFAGEQKPFVVQLVNPPAGQLSGGSYSPVSMTGTTLDISVSATPSGTNTVAAVAQVTGIAWDSGNQWHSGVLDLSPAGVLTLIGTGPSITAWIEFRWWNGTNPVFTYQQSFTLRAPIDKGSTGTPPLPAASYFNTQQSDGRYITWEVPPGFAITFLTTDPKKKLALTVNDDLDLNWQKIILP